MFSAVAVVEMFSAVTVVVEIFSVVFSAVAVDVLVKLMLSSTGGELWGRVNIYSGDAT